MNPLNLFISSSDRAKPVTIGRVAYVGAWVAIGLAVIDVFINLAFPYPSDPKNLNPSWLQAYFEYGRSSEAKLRRMTRKDPAQTAPITLAGWYEPIVAVQKPSPPETPVVTFYGMSHAGQLAYALDRVTKRFIARIVAAPGATANWAYGAYLRDHGGGKSRVAVLALMSVNVAMITAVSPMTWNIDFPMPYTADRFYVQGDDLRVVHPPFSSFEQYADAFDNPQKWAAARDELAKTDTLYDSFIMRANFLDHSSLFRLIRRAYGQRLVRDAHHAVLERGRFEADSEQIKLARVIVRKFADGARADGMIPIIYIVNNLGYSDTLYQALKPTLESNDIPYLSSHTVASPNDPRMYVPNSHFRDDIDDEMARALIKVIERVQEQEGKPSAQSTPQNKMSVDEGRKVQ